MSVLSVGNDLLLVSQGTQVPPGLWTCDDSVFCNMTDGCEGSEGLARADCTLSPVRVMALSLVSRHPCHCWIVIESKHP